MNTDIALLAKFLDSLDPEVSGRSSAPLDDKTKESIRLFATGSLGPSERQSLLNELLQNEVALHTLVNILQKQV